MNWTQFIAWVNDPARTRDELKDAYTTAGLTGLAAGAPTLSYKGALLAHATSQPDLTATIPAALATAIGAPATVVTPAAATTPPATPAPATPAPTRSFMQRFGGIALLGAAVAALFIAFFGEDVGLLDEDLTDSGGNNGTVNAEERDSDDDGLTNDEEDDLGTDPRNSDSDDDGTNDGDDDYPLDANRGGTDDGDDPAVPTATPKPGTPAGGNPIGGITTQTACGSVTWGPAGAAPGSDTTDSMVQVNEAAAAMDVDPTSALTLTVHKMFPGCDVPNGWILGSSMTEANGIKVSAGHLPAGTCIDYDPGATQITGEVWHTEVQNPKWTRTLLKSDGSATGLKMTVYWTPCVFKDGFQPTGQILTSANPVSSGPCPTSADSAANMLGGSASDWSAVPPNGWRYSGSTTIGPLTAPTTAVIDYDPATGGSGRAKAGEQTPEGTAFTVYCPA